MKGCWLASAVAGTAMIAALRGDEQACRATVQTGLALSERTEALAAIVACESAIGLLCPSLGDYAGTDRHLGGLCGSFVINSYEPAVIAFVTDAAEALLGLGRTAEAGSILEQYESRARSLGNEPALAAALRCCGLLDAAVGDLPSAISNIEAARSLAAAGRTKREIASELFVSIRAVEKILTSVYRKLGVRSRTELAALLTHDERGRAGEDRAGSR
jgi:Bacterial regulatory proteins, luxR family